MSSRPASTSARTSTSTRTSTRTSTSTGTSTSTSVAEPSATMVCPPPATRCDEGQVQVLVDGDGACRWECQADPLYVAPSNDKGPIIGGSLGAAVCVLAVLLGLLLFAHCKRTLRERAAYAKDARDLASELSDEPLLKDMREEGASAPGSSAGSATAEGSGLAARLAPLFLGLGDLPAAQGSRADAPFRAERPALGAVGTELTMDVFDRPPEADPTLAIADGAAPYRREKTASAYPQLAVFAYPHDPHVLDERPDAAAAAAAALVAHPSQPADVWRAPYAAQRGPVPGSPEDLARLSYDKARRSGSMAIAAARGSSLGM
ncbi:hypothetical protein H4R18_004522 [Coemansia javaensis]|uniref:Uncharacterized protein n=1 Tax=Coemansia javaensis TaxID=2761396 RepID=A0A9W8H8S1_9FUNG|nr:hypothetical protein H4R18_004522 [Coemansia javaensis]